MEFFNRIGQVQSLPAKQQSFAECLLQLNCGHALQRRARLTQKFYLARSGKMIAVLKPERAW